MCYHAEFGRARSWESVVDPINLGPPLKMGRVWPLETCCAPTCVTLTNLIPVGCKRLIRNCRDHPEKFDPSRPALQGHSRSLELTWIHRLPMASYLCSIVTMGLSGTVFEIKMGMRKKTSHRCTFNAPAEGVLVEFCTGGSLQKSWMIPLLDR